MQYPVEVPGVSVSNFLRTAATAIRGEAPKLRTWVKEVKEAMATLQMDPAFAERNVNEGFSGGEKKRHEILQLELLKPKIAILDETDSGLDVDALRQVSEGINRVASSGEVGTLLVTHYTRILKYVKPDFVHVFSAKPDRRVRWRRARRQAGERGLRGIREGWRFRVTTHDSALAEAQEFGDALRKDFPILQRVLHDDKPLVYLDNAATSQKPQQVLDALNGYYERHNANVHRGVHVLAEEATALYEGARDKVAAFINAPSRDEVIFTKNASESLNLVANMLGWAEEPYRVDADAEVVITEMEHHSNIVPWQLLSQRTGAKLKWFGLTDEGLLRPVEHQRADQREDEDRLLHAGLQPARYRQPGRGHRPAGPGRRRAGADRRLAGGPAHGAGRAGAGRRLRRLHRSQDAGPDGHRRAVG